MTLRNIVNALRSQGHRVRFVERKDGSIRVTRVDGQRFSARLSTGNKVARAMAGQTLSERRSRQLETQRKYHAAKRAHRVRTRALPTVKIAMMKEIRKAQAKIRRLGGKGTITTKNVRYIIEQYGEEEAYKRIRATVRYYQGYAYIDNVLFLTRRIEALAQNTGSASLARIAAWVRANAEIFREEWIQPAYDALYDCELTLRLSSDKNEKQRAIETCAATLRSIFAA